MTVYLLHLKQPLSRGTSPSGKPLSAQHYVGYADDLVARLLAHQETTWMPFDEPVVGQDGSVKAGERRGKGATFMGFANYAGVGWQLARTWDGAGRRAERLIKAGKNAPKLCPVCNPRAMLWKSEEALERALQPEMTDDTGPALDFPPRWR